MPFLIISLGLASCASRSGSAVQTQEPSQPFPVQVSSSLSPEKRLPEAEIAETEAPKTVAREVQLSQGYGDALKNLPTYRHCPKKGEKVYPIELNLQNADLVEAIKVLSDTLGLNYAIDPRVKGTVNVRASGRLTRSELLSIMENLLLVNGATLVQNGQFINIVPAKEAVTGAVPVYRRGRMPEGTFAQVISLDQTSSKEMLNVLKPLVSQAGSISEGAGNSLILVDYPANIEKILELIHLIDSRALNKSMVRMVKVDNASPPSIIAELESIFSSFGALGKKENFGVNFIPVDRMNSVLVLASSRALMDRAISWIHELDSRSDALANVHVYHVENYKAKNLANILRQSYGETPSGLGIKEAKSKKSLTGSKSPGTSMTTAGDGTTTGGSTMTGATMGGTTTGSSAMGSNFASLGGGSEGTSERSLSDQNEQAVPFSGSKGGTESGKENVRIIPDEENNLLVVIAPPYEWQTIQSLLRRLDIMPRQVLSEVLIAEISLTGQLKYGLEWFFKGNPSSTTSTTTGDQTSTTSATSSTISFSSFTGPLGAAYNASGFTFVANDVYNNLRGFINLLAEEGKVNILASPHIMAANNQEAAIQIGDEVPILTSQSVPLVSQQTSFQTSTINYRNTGILLKLKPQINSRGLVTLEIAQEVSSASATTTGVNNTPTISVRQAKTTLTTANNQTVVLGGLIREDLTRRRSGIPGLRNVPILGPVFGSENKQKNRTELIVLITPHVVNSLEEGARITDKMKRGMNPEAFGGGKGGNTSSPPPIERQQ